MARVEPFRALRYDPGRVDLAAVTSPPHDVISAAQKLACMREPLNIVRLTLPEEGGEARFARAAAHLKEWRQQGFLERDAAPAFYRYEVTFPPTAEGEPQPPMRGFFARVGLDPEKRQVRPHERTLASKKGDRLLVREATQCDVEPIWLLYRDPERKVEALLQEGDELVRFAANDGTVYRLSRVTDADALAGVTAWFSDQTLVIADGHHRYQSAVEHMGATGRPEHATILALVCSDTDPGVRVEATHRLVRWDRTIQEALAASRTGWRPQELPRPKQEAGSWQRAARELLQSLEGAGTAIVVGRADGEVEAHALWLQTPREPAELGVTLVQERLLLTCWGLEEGMRDAVTYERDAAECLRRVAEGEADLAVLLPPERVGSVLDAAKEGRLMPAKATYFIPKPPSGLVLAPLDES